MCLNVTCRWMRPISCIQHAGKAKKSVIIFSGIYVELRVGDLTDAKQTQLTLGIQK